jgi:hypothetical protein
MPDIEAGQPQPNIIEQGIPHERLVQTFRSLIKEQQDVHTSLRSFGEMSNEPEVLSPERAVRGVLDWYAGSGNKELSEHMFTVRSAWDALSYDRYEAGSREEGLAGSILQAYASATGEPKIKLTHPTEVRVLDALTEAAGVPHQRGQTENEASPQQAAGYHKEGHCL